MNIGVVHRWHHLPTALVGTEHNSLYVDDSSNKDIIHFKLDLPTFRLVLKEVKSILESSRRDDSNDYKFDIF